MCGVVGVLGTPNRANRQVFQDMLCFGAKRGPHSTGIVAASRKGAYMVKDVGLPWDLLRSKDYHENVVGKNWPVLMGHNRWATVGKVNVANAHPFWHKPLILMHNGTLEKGWDLQHWNTYDTDSECIAWNFANNGVKETYKKMSGAWTLVWWDENTGLLNAISNGQRPFCFIKSADGKSMYWASEEWIIRFACEGRGIPLEKSCWVLTSHTLYQFFTNKKGMVDFTTEALEPKATVPFVWTGKSYSQKWDEEDDAEQLGNFLGFSAKSSTGTGNTTSSETSGTNVVVMGPKKKGGVVLLDDKGQPVQSTKDEHPYGKALFIYKTAFEYKEKHGQDHCVLCGCDVADEYLDAIVIDPETVACGTCQDFCEIQEPKINLV